MIRSNKLHYISLFILLQSMGLKAQYYETGQDRASLRWETVKTDHFKFIFPVSYRDEAIRASLVYEEAYSILAGSLREPAVKKFPVIIHNHSIESNGFVAWAPKRMELFPLPPQDNLPMGHHQQLALHELTHVIQMQALTTGISKPLSYILGEQYTGALGIFTPFWFLEGNAVVSESVYSYSGRGRVPAFEKQLKALLLDGEKIFSYDKMINGSFSDYTPDHYQFGYQMSAWAIKTYGSDIWSDALHYTSSRPFTANPFNFSMRKNQGITKKKLYIETMNHLAATWREEEKGLQPSGFDTVNMDKGGEFVNYYSPVRLGENRIAAIKYGLSDIPSIVSIDTRDRSEKILHIPGYMWPAKISSSNGMITWAENRYDPRWANQGYSVIKIFDTSRGRIRTISEKTRYFSPSLSHRGSLVAATESTPDYTNSLVIIDSFTGDILSSISLPGNIMPVMPVWSEDDNRIFFISYSDEGEGVMSYNRREGTTSILLPQGRDDLESLAVKGDTLLFTSSFSGIDNIYALLPSGEIYGVGSTRFGISDISATGDEILFSDYTASGYNIGKLSISGSISGSPVQEGRSPSPVSAIDSEIKIGEKEDLYSGETVVTGPYKKWKHLFSFHSWMPFWADINNISVDNLAVSPGITLMSQNHLSSMITTLGYEYRAGDHLLHTTLNWKGWYPAFELDMTLGGTPAIIQGNDVGSEPSNIMPGVRTSAAVYLPLNFYSGRFNQTIWPYLRISYSNNYVYNEDNAVYDYGQFLASSRFYFSNLHRMSKRDIWPRWGQVLDLNNVFSPSDKNLYGPVTSIRTTFYIPGLFKNHSIRLTAQAEKKEFRELLINNRILLPRGYLNVVPEKASVFTADYALPVAYPDFNIGGLLYLQRIRADLFYDYASASENYYFVKREMVNGTEIFSSLGTELLADFYLLRIPFRLSAGIQAAWLPQKREPYFNMLFNIDIFGFVLGRQERY